MREIVDCKSKASKDQLTLDLSLESVFALLDEDTRQTAKKYQAALNERHALDFADLVFYTRAMLFLSDDVHQRW